MHLCSAARRRFTSYLLRGNTMPEFIMPLSSIDEVRTFNSLDEFTRGYIEAMFWTECNSDSEPELEDATFDDLAPETLARIIADCASFQNMPDSPDNDSDLEAYAYDYSLAYAGHDFWLTRNRHGAGFWARETSDDFDDNAQHRLTDRAHN